MTLDIAVPFYGDVSYLKQAVLSVIAQNDPDWRLIVIDDCYPDDTLSAWFASLRDSRISYQRNTKNLGPNGNYQKAVSFLESKYAIILGADDVLLPNFVSHIKEQLHQRKEFDVLQVRVDVIDEIGSKARNLEDGFKQLLRSIVDLFGLHSGQKAATVLLIGNWTYFPSIVWRTEILNEVCFRDEFNVCQDLGLLLDVVSTGRKIITSKERAFQYRRHLKSDSSTKAISGERFMEEKAFYSIFSKEFSSKKWHVASATARLRPTSRLNEVRFKIVKKRLKR